MAPLNDGGEIAHPTRHHLSVINGREDSRNQQDRFRSDQNAAGHTARARECDLAGLPRGQFH